MRQQHQPHKANVAATNAHIHNGLGEERKQQLHACAGQQTQQQLRPKTLVAAHVTPQKCSLLAGFGPMVLPLSLKKSRLRLEQQGYAHIAPVALAAHPVLIELIGTVGQFALAGVGHVECMLAVAPPFHAVQHHKMLLIPVQDAGQHVLRNQIFCRDAPTHGFEAQLLGAAAYGQQRHAQLVELAQLAYLVHVGRATVVRHNHG